MYGCKLHPWQYFTTYQARFTQLHKRQSPVLFPFSINFTHLDCQCWTGCSQPLLEQLLPSLVLNTLIFFFMPLNVCFEKDFSELINTSELKKVSFGKWFFFPFAMQLAFLPTLVFPSGLISFRKYQTPFRGEDSRFYWISELKWENAEQLRKLPWVFLKFSNYCLADTNLTAKVQIFWGLKADSGRLTVSAWNKCVIKYGSDLTDLIMQLMS